MTYPNIHPGIFLKRPNRFIAHKTRSRYFHLP